MEPLKWWGYVHTNGTLQGPKRYFEPLDIEEAEESPFVKEICRPFESDTSEGARAYLQAWYLGQTS